MALVSIAPPPGVYRNGSIQQAKGRWCDANLVRFQQGEVKPVGGWQKRSATAAPFEGAARAVLSWRDNLNSRWIAVGTHSRLYVQTEAGDTVDITPARRTAPLAADALTTETGRGGLTIHDPGHGAAAGETVHVIGAI